MKLYLQSEQLCLLTGNVLKLRGKPHSIGLILQTILGTKNVWRLRKK